MERLIYLLARGSVALLQQLPLRWVARLGRTGGALAYVVDRRHRQMTKANLTRCFSRELTRTEIAALARENFRRIGENFACAVKTASMNEAQLKSHLSFSPQVPWYQPGSPERVVVVLGHFGNFELYTRIRPAFPGRPLSTTYRALPHPALNRLLGEIRAKSGIRFFERRAESSDLRAFMLQSGTVLGLLADQNAGASGLRMPFLGHECSTSPAPAVFALRYDCRLVPSICYRVGLAEWRIQLGEEVPLRENGNPRPLQSIMADVNRAFEEAVRRDPANWFWVHNRWKARRFRAKRGASASLREEHEEETT